MNVIGLVVPALEHGGGVPAVADFICGVISRTDRFRLRLISLSQSAIDHVGVAVSRPSSWLRGVQVEEDLWQGRPFSRIGSFGSEMEFQRYMPRAVLANALADCSLVQVVAGSPAWANAVIGLGKPVSLQVATRAKVERLRRGSRSDGSMAWWRKAMTEITDRYDDRALRAVDAVQLENPWMLEYARTINTGRADVDISYSPPGVDAARFCPLPNRGGEAKPYILCVGRLDDPRKNVELVLKAFQQLPPSLSHVNLVTAGAGRPSPEYWAQVEALGLSRRINHVHRPDADDLVKLFQHAAALALASDEEGFGMVVIEAMSCGVPVVATRCGGPDGIISDGEDGFLVPLNDATSMADRLSILCSDAALNVRMGQAARATVEVRYADDVAGQAFIDVWDRLLQTNGKR
jgi:D-inositol-3-phosphate glycosyltransferase